MIQLQHIDATEKNLGGLYVCPSEIAAIFTNYAKASTYIVLKSGREFRTAQTASELLDLVATERKEQRK